VPDVVIVGAGLHGLATAAALADDGLDVVVREQFASGHTRGSSHGRSRIYRLAYHDPKWVELMQEALAGWRRLEEQSGETLLVETGLIELVSELDHGSVGALTALGIAWEELSAADAESRFGVRIGDRRAIHQPEAGVVLSDRALAAFRAQAERGGARFEEQRRVERLDDLDAGVVVVTAGAWARPLLATAGIDLPVRVTRETVSYFRMDGRPPAFVEFTEDGRGHGAYALYDPVHGLKVGLHHGGPVVDSGDDAGEPDPRLEEQVSAWVARHVPAADPKVLGSDTCFYTTTADESFVLERHGRIVVGSACSGHGFKFGPAVGERLAALAREALR
jgi:sarcosine oxidase